MTFNRETEGIEVVKLFREQAEGKTILITGASSGGLGSEAALSLAHANPAHLLLTARSENKVTPIIQKIQQINPSIRATFVQVELDDFDSVRRAAGHVNSQITVLDILINNAGIMAVQKFTKNKNGIESQFATNHLGHFLLTALLFPTILAAGRGARIINLTSDGFQIEKFRPDDYNFQDGEAYDPWSAYGQSKTANILFTRYLGAKLTDRGIASFAVHPGVIFGTSLGKHLDRNDPNTFGNIPELAKRNTGVDFVMNEPKSIQQGVATTLITALDPGIADFPRTFWADGKEATLPEYASSLDNAQKLWALSERLVGQKFDL